jgi:hypothetical protein
VKFKVQVGVKVDPKEFYSGGLGFVSDSFNGANKFRFRGLRGIIAVD